MNYTQKSFKVGGYGQKYAAGWDKAFGQKRAGKGPGRVQDEPEAKEPPPGAKKSP